MTEFDGLLDDFKENVSKIFETDKPKTYDDEEDLAMVLRMIVDTQKSVYRYNRERRKNNERDEGNSICSNYK